MNGLDPAGLSVEVRLRGVKEEEMMLSRCAAMTTAILLLAGLSAYPADGTLVGRVGFDGSGSPVVAGAVIRTEGEPTYSATSAADGTYTFAAPPNTYNVLVSAAGMTPQRVSVTMFSGATTTANFALRSAASGGVTLSMPAPLDWGEPASAPAPPGDSFPVSFSDMRALPTASAPQISGWNETVKPDESFTMTGARFSVRTGADLGTDTIVWVWSRTSSTGGKLRQARLWRVTENTLTATLPDDVPFGMYLVWVENANGVSSPVCLNKTTSHWIGPLGNIVQAGNTKRIFGRNISYAHGTTTAYVYMQPASGVSLIPCSVGAVNPFMVEFVVPPATPNGNYKVYVHNGHGGIYGWSDPLDLVVQPDWVRDNNEYSAPPPTGGDDTANIQNAINTQNARSNGGTVRLAAGTYRTYDTITLRGNVRFAGAGMDSTIIELRLNSPRSSYLSLSEDNVTIEGLTLKGCLTGSPAQPSSGVISGSNADSFKMIDSRVTSETGIYCFYNYWGSSRTEMSGCEFYREVSAGWVDGWVHNCNLYGGPYGVYYPVTPGYVGETESPYDMSIRAVFENSHVETRDWPVNRANGSPNYNTANRGWLTYDQYAFKPWAKRVACVQNKIIYDNYIANLTSTNVAVEDNRGEMMLFHGIGASWMGNMLSSNRLTLNLRTDGIVNGQPGVHITNYTNGWDFYAGGTVPNSRPSWINVDGSYAVIIAGKGVGQKRTIVSHTTTSITVDKPWRIQPDTTSVIVTTLLYSDNTIYNNDLNAFPVGYIQDSTASQGVDMDGNCWNNVAERNTSRRTNGARSILANSGGPSYWCTMRDESAVDVHEGGYFISWWEHNPYGMLSIGNAYHNCSGNTYAPDASGAVWAKGEGSVLENMTVSAMTGYSLPGATQAGDWPDGFTLFRNGNVTAIDGPPVPVSIAATDGKQFLINNRYTGASTSYFLSTGLSSYSIPAPAYRCVKMTGYVGYPVQPAILAVANAGIQSVTWTATSSDAWITPSVQANGSLAAESALGRLVIGVNTAGMIAGKHWGSVTVSNGTSRVKVGVCVDLAGGAPQGAAPHASFTLTPGGGTAPLTVGFNAGASSDADGSIVSYDWDFGDGSYGTGVTTSHTYSNANTYTPVLTVTDNSGASDTSWANVVVAPVLSAVSLTGSPLGAIAVNTPVTLTATATGGYQVLYKFMIKTATGWNTLRDYGSGSTFTWTPTSSGYYELKVWARNSAGATSYDAASNLVSYPVGLLPSGMKLWIKADSGISKDSFGSVSNWADQSGAGNNLNQVTDTYKPTSVDNAINGRPVVRFVGPGQFMQTNSQLLNGATSFTAFTVGKFNQTPAGAYQYFWWNGADSSSGGYGCYLHTTGYLRSAWGGNASAVTDPNPPTAGNLYRICSRFTSALGSGPNEMWTNGTYITSRSKTGSSLSGGTFTVGNFGPSAGYGLYGDIAELLVYDRALTDTERANVDSYLQSRWIAATPASKDRLKDVKALNDGILVSVSSPKVATVGSGVYSDGSVYMSEPDRTCGMKIVGARSIAIWDNLILTGTTDTDEATGERLLRVSSVSTASGSEMTPLGLSNKAFSASGQLVRVWGRVTYKTASFVTIDDGSGTPVKAQIDGLVSAITKTVNTGDYISVTGPSGLAAGGTAVVRARSDSDIQVY